MSAGLYDYNEKEIELAKEIWKLIQRFDLKQQDTDEDCGMFSNDEPMRKDEIYITINEVFNMKKLGYFE